MLSRILAAAVILSPTARAAAAPASARTLVETELRSVAPKLVDTPEADVLKAADTFWAKMRGQGLSAEQVIRESVVYLANRSNSEPEGMGGWILLVLLPVDSVEKVRVASSFYESSNRFERKYAELLFGGVEGRDGADRAAKLYEVLLKSGGREANAGLISYLYAKDPAAAVTLMATVFSPGENYQQLVARISAANDKGARYFAARDEWWAQLYAAFIVQKKRVQVDDDVVNRLAASKEKAVRDLVEKR